MLTPESTTSWMTSKVWLGTLLVNVWSVLLHRSEQHSALISLLERPDLWRIIRSPHWEKVTTAMHDIEWVDSSDYLRGDEDEAIRACLADFESMLKKKKKEEEKK